MDLLVELTGRERPAGQLSDVAPDPALDEIADPPFGGPGAAPAPGGGGGGGGIRIGENQR
ncbi:MAG: hypothetical protein ACK5RL_04775 [Acidimicrobiales bacterium]